MKLTTANVGLSKGKTDEIIFDSVLRGFGLRIKRGSGGVLLKRWIIQYRQDGHQRRMIVGDAVKLTPAQAREKARKLLAEVQLGHDPQRDRRERHLKDSLSLRGVVTEFLASKTGIKESSMRMLHLYLEKGAYLGSLRSMPVDRIRRADIASRVLAVQRDNGIATANAFRVAMSSLFSFALTSGLIESNPVIGAFKPPRSEPRDRVLSDVELAKIWNGVEGGGDYAACVRLLICTGSRRQEIGGARWPEFDFDKGLWVLPKERSKNGRPLTLPVTGLMKEIIESVPVRDDYLFGKRGFTTWALSKRGLDDKLNLPHWTHHDIRRSVASGMGDLAIQPHIVEEILNHKSGSKRGVAGTYNKSPYANEVRDAMLRWSDHIHSLITGGERRVLPFEQRVTASS